MPHSKLIEIIESLHLEDATDIIRRAYREQGYTGLFGNTAKFLFHRHKAELFAPRYTQYMLYGRRPGKMPPLEPIQLWMERYNIPGNPWGVAKKIARYGTKGNNFLPSTLPAVIQSVNLRFVPEVTKLILSELRDMSMSLGKWAQSEN